MTTLGTTLFSLTPEWRRGADAAALLERLAAVGCGPAIEVIGYQAWRGFPAISADDERAFRSAVDAHGLRPVALGVYTDLFRRPGRPMTEDDAFEDIAPQLAAAARLGFAQVRAPLGMADGLLRRVVDEAERLGLVVTVEVQGTNAPDSPPVVEVLELQRATGTAHLGFTIDFSLTTAALPVAFGSALRRLGLAGPDVAEVHRIWSTDDPIGQRIGAALAVLRGQPNEAALSTLVAGILMRSGRWRPADWADVLPLARHAHAKFFDPAVESVRASHATWLSALADVGYTGAVVSEWGGHELLDRADADALAVTRAHHNLLDELVAGLANDRAAVTA
jgi:sugar phosphate isomerase/epimerase